MAYGHSANASHASLRQRLLALLIAALLALGAGSMLQGCAQTDASSAPETPQAQSAANKNDASSASKDAKKSEVTERKAAENKDSKSSPTASSSSSKKKNAKASDSSKDAKKNKASEKTKPSSKKSSSSSAGSKKNDSSSSKSPSPAAKIKVSVYVDASNAADAGYAPCFFNGTVTLKQGASVYDALEATGLSFSGSSSYISAIGGLAEKQVGKASGWMYEVNGATPMKTCGSCKLSSGDSVRWYYVTSYSDR